MTPRISAIEERLALSLEAAALGTWIWDMASGTTEWDARLEALHGLEPGTFGGTFDDWVAAMHPDDRSECLATVQEALAEPGAYVLNHRTVWPDGSIRFIECRGTVLVDDGGRPIGTTGVAMDVTERAQKAADDHRLVETLQQALLPTRMPTVPGVAVAVRYAAAAGGAAIGGDWYAVVPLADGRLGLAIGDVAGHGLPAVSDMADARFSLRALALTQDAPERVLERLNEVVRIFEGDTLITALYGIVDPAAERVSFAVAGHHPPLVCSPDGTARFATCAADPPLGYGGSYQRHYVDLAHGSSIVLYTDGLIERRREPITSGLGRLLAACRDAPRDPEKLCDHLLEHLLEDTPNEDDVAMVVATLE